MSRCVVKNNFAIFASFYVNYRTEQFKSRLSNDRSNWFPWESLENLPSFLVESLRLF